MLKSKIILSLLALACFAKLPAQSGKAPLSKDRVLQIIYDKLEETQQVFNWKDALDHEVYSALMLTDSVLNIGYRPMSEPNAYRDIHLVDVNKSNWKATKDEIMNMIIDHHASKNVKIDMDYLFPKTVAQSLPFFHARVFDEELIKKIREMETVTFSDVYNFDLVTIEAKKDGLFGCGSGGGAISAADYIEITPDARQSWHHAEHNVACAWADGNAGEGKTIAVFDTGISDLNPKFNAEFTEGDSGGRTIVKKGFYDPAGGTNYDGVVDDCGHGTAMAGLAAAPRGFDDSPAGVAYKANLVTYRVACDVLIGSGAEKNGVIAGYLDVAGDPDIDIVSMSLGDLFYDGAVHMAIKTAANNGKLIFNAAGTSFPLAPIFVGVIFPANQKETLAVTGVDEGSMYNNCQICHTGDQVDFVVSMERADGTHGLSTAMTDAAGNGFQEYVGGSSCATATMAGIAAVAWANNCDLDCGQIMNRLIKSTDNYPNKDDNYGWGRVDACAAAENESWRMPCDPGVQNQVTMEITKISFPAIDDGFGDEAEIIIEINGTSYYFDVSEDGVTRGFPAHCLADHCTFQIPITVDLGTTSCGQAEVDIMVSSHEDDGITAGCECDDSFFGGDDNCTDVETYVVSMHNRSFTHQTAISGGAFVFEYDLFCTPMDPPQLSLNGAGDQTLCLNDTPADIMLTASGGTAEYTITYNINGGSDMTVNTTSSTASITPATNAVGTFVYNFTNVEDATGCNSTIEESVTITINPDTEVPTINMVTCGTNVIVANATDIITIAAPDNVMGGASVSNFDLSTGVYTAQFGDAAGSFDIIVTNEFGCGAQTITINTPECTAMCPNVTTIDEQNVICDEDLTTEVTSWQTSLSTDADIMAAANHSNTGSIMYSTVLASGTTGPNGSTADGNHDSDQGCSTDTQETYAYLLCFGENGNNENGSGDDIWILLGTNTLTVYPAQPTVRVATGEETEVCSEGMATITIELVSENGTVCTTKDVDLTAMANMSCAVVSEDFDDSDGLLFTVAEIEAAMGTPSALACYTQQTSTHSLDIMPAQPSVIFTSPTDCSPAVATIGFDTDNDATTLEIVCDSQTGTASLAIPCGTGTNSSQLDYSWSAEELSVLMFGDNTKASCYSEISGSTTSTCPQEACSLSLSISDPCDCNTDQTVNGANGGAGSGTFSETVQIMAEDSNGDPATDLSLCVANGSMGVSPGTTIGHIGGGVYEISFNHTDNVGYSLLIAECSDLDVVLSGPVTNTCHYPIAQFSLPTTICEDATMVDLSVLASEVSGDGDFGGSFSFSGTGVTGTMFDPATAGPGSVMITATYTPTMVVGDNPGDMPNCPTSIIMTIEVEECCDASHGVIGIQRVEPSNRGISNPKKE